MKKRKIGFLACQYAEKPKAGFGKADLDIVPISPANQKALEAVSEGDEKPFEFVQEIRFGDKYPATDGSIYDASWAKSYAEKANSVLLPGSKDGHTTLSKWHERVENHLYVTGAKISGDSLFIRHYVSNKMPDYEYQKLIGEIKAGLIGTSVISFNEYDYTPEHDGQKAVWRAIKSLGRERNDLVEWDQTGMYSRMIATSQKDVIENSEEGDEEMGERIGYTEAVTTMKSIIDENKSDHLAVMKDLGLKVEVLSDSQKAELAVMKQLREIAGDSDIVQIVSDSVNSQKTAFETLRDAAVQKAFGANSLVLASAKDHFSAKTGGQKEIDAEIERIKGLASMKDLAGSSSDGLDNLAGSSHGSGQKEIRIGDGFAKKGGN